MLYGLDTTISASVQGPILASLGEIEKLAWVGIGFPMGSVSVILLLGWCYAVFQIKYLMIGSIVTFEVGSALCGAAPTMNAMIFGRVIAGIGGAGMYLGALTYVSTFTPLSSRAIYNALIGLCWGTGCILGPLIGGSFAVSSATWRWAFYINIPLAAVLSPVYIFYFPKHNPQPETSGPTKLARIDWVGAVLNATVFTLFQVVLTFAGSTWKWNAPGPIALWVVFGASLIAYIVQQIFSLFTTPERQLFPIHLLKSRTQVLLYIGTAASAAALSAGVYYVPLFFQFTRGDSAIRAAVRLLPFITITIFFVMLTGGLLPILGRYAPLYVLSGIFIVIGGALMHTVDVTTNTSAIYGYEVLMAIGIGSIMQVAYSVSVVKVKQHDVQNAIGFINVGQIGTMAIALSIAASIFQNRGLINLKEALQGYGFSELELRGALAGAQSAVLMGGNEAVKAKAVAAIVKTMDSIWIMTIVAGAVSFVSGMLMRWEKVVLDKVGV
ncbi:MFS general substrate transporter [Stipitochalara longipes BDJ]|nr:MFS general substrate transporter [Stipitochalara longipes BDJ]